MSVPDEQVTHLPIDAITTGQAARLVGVATQTVANWLKSGKIRGWQRGRWKVLSRAELLEFVRPVEVPKERESPRTKAEMERAARDAVKRMRARRSTRRVMAG